MSTGDLLNIHPSELRFPFELKKLSSCYMQLTNKTDQYVVFKVKTTNPKKYCVRPNNGILPRGSSSGVTVTMQAPKDAPPDLQCKDKFLIQSVVAPNASTTKELTPEMFNKEDGKVVEEFKLRVFYVPANPPSPVPEGSEEGSSPRGLLVEDGSQSASVPDAAWSMMSKLTEEKASAIQQNQKLHQELRLVRKQISKNRDGGFSMVFVAIIGFLRLLIGYLLNRT